MFVLKDVLMDEKEDRGDDLPGANPFVGGDGESDAAQEAEDRGDSLEEGTSPEAEAAEEAPAPEEVVDDSSAVSDESDDVADDDSADDDEGDDDEDSGDVQPASPMIPKKRFDAVNERMKRAEQRLADLERQREAQVEAEEDTFDFDAKEKEYMEAVLDADHDKALAIRSEIRAAEEARFEARSNSVTKEAVTQSSLQREFDDTVATLETYNDILNPNTEAYDNDLVEEIVVLQGSLLRGEGGYTPGEALMKAAQYVMGKDLVTEDLDSEPEPEPAPKPKKNQGDIKKKVAQAKAQAPDMNAGDSSSTAGEGVINVDDLSEEDFDALPESKKRALRGDVI